MFILKLKQKLVMTNITLFAQIINLLNSPVFSKLVDKFDTDKHNKGINSWTHLVTMLFCHFAKANSLREISNGLRSASGNLNHLGIMNKAPSKSTISYINEHRKWELFRDYYFKLYDIFCTEAKFKQKKFKIKKKVLIMDSTMVSLCLSIFDWAAYQQTKGAMKLHMLLDFDSCLPVYVHMTEGKTSDVAIAQQLDLPSKSVIVADRGYIDFDMLNKWHKKEVNFVVRLKDNINYIDVKERPLPENRAQNILKDEEIILLEKETYNKYPRRLRRVAVYNEQYDETIEIITNNFSWTAYTLSELYKSRWQIEIFFKMLKSNFKIKTFVGTSPNAVLIQIWTALITIMILKYLKEISKHHWILSNLLAFLRMNLFVKISLHQWINEPFKPPPEEDSYTKLQVKLFE